MLINTHLLIAKSINDNIDPSKSFFISEKNFIYGNIKPDLTSKYLLNKHYFDESYDMIRKKVHYLCSLTLDDISKYFSISSLSQELGVICHFLCDFFCVAHFSRWEMTHSLNKHMQYEKDLNKVAKSTNLNIYKGEFIDKHSFEIFFNDLYEQYQQSTSPQNDLLFSTTICNSFIEYILDSILSNTANKYKLVI